MKKKREFTVVVFLLLILSSVSLSRDYFYYTSDGRVDLNPTSSTITVMPDMSCFTDWESIIGADSALCDTILPIAVSDSFYLLTVCEGYSVDSLLGRLRTRADVTFAHPVFADCSERNIYMGRLLTVIYKATTTVAEIEAVIEANDLTLVDTLFGDYRFQVLRATGATSRDVLSIANGIFESGIAKLAQAGLAFPFDRDGYPSDMYWSYQWSGGPPYRWVSSRIWAADVPVCPAILVTYPQQSCGAPTCRGYLLTCGLCGP